MLRTKNQGSTKKLFSPVQFTIVMITLPMVLSAQIAYKDLEQEGNKTSDRMRVITQENLFRDTDTMSGQRVRIMHVKHLENANENNIVIHKNSSRPDTLRRKMIRADSLILKKSHPVDPKSTTTEQPNIPSSLRGWNKRSTDE